MHKNAQYLTIKELPAQLSKRFYQPQRIESVIPLIYAWCEH